MNTSDLEFARAVIDAEARAVSALAERLDDGFFQACDAVLGCRGRVVVCGMGKAGLIGQKMSATLASTGTPSIFLHPAEAIHGDLGRIVSEDVAIFLSNSGESSEITALLPHIRRLGVHLIAITGKRESTLAREADDIVDIGVIPEACPHDLAPTASTAALLAIGDAIALVVMRRRGFSREQYAMNHPGGALGRRLMRVRDVMATGDRVALAAPDTDVRSAVNLVITARVGCLLVHEAGSRKLAGILTDGDIRRHLMDATGTSLLERPVREVMSPDPTTIAPDAFALEAVSTMRDHTIDGRPHRIGDLPVVDDQGQILGVVYLKDLLELGL